MPTRDVQEAASPMGGHRGPPRRFGVTRRRGRPWCSGGRGRWYGASGSPRFRGASWQRIESVRMRCHQKAAGRAAVSARMTAAAARRAFHKRASDANSRLARNGCLRHVNGKAVASSGPVALGRTPRAAACGYCSRCPLGCGSAATAGKSRIPADGRRRERAVAGKTFSYKRREPDKTDLHRLVGTHFPAIPGMLRERFGPRAKLAKFQTQALLPCRARRFIAPSIRARRACLSTAASSSRTASRACCASS